MLQGYIPSNDFQLFEIPQFGGLFSDSLGISNRFNSADPTSYVNYALNTFAAIQQPQNVSSIPPTPNYGSGFEVNNASDLFFPIAPLIQPQAPAFFQGQQNQAVLSPDQIARLKKVRQQADEMLGTIGQGSSSSGGNATVIISDKSGASQSSGIKKCDENSTFWQRVTGQCCTGQVIDGKCTTVSDGSGSGDSRVIGNDPTKSGDKVQTIVDFFKTLPEGSGLFLIAVAIIVLILLFAKGR